MGFHWNFFDPVEELVYAADTQTHGLVYMNPSLLETLGMDPGAEYRGEKCYAVLQGRQEPCEFCSNAELREGKFHRWSYFNPLIKKKVDISDTLVRDGGRRCRLEICRDAEEHPNGARRGSTYTPSEALVNECMQQALETDDYNEVIQRALAFAGSRFQCSRVYIFENYPTGRTSNTYEWCAPGVAPEKEFLQNEPIEVIESWMRYFRQDRPVILENIEDIRDSDPALYSTLKPQDIQSLLCWPLRSKKEIIGFIGLDNPLRRQFPVILSFLRVIEHFIVSWLRRRDMTRALEEMSCHDVLTGALNRVAFRHDVENPVAVACMGVLYCDIIGVRSVNDQSGCAAGDALIQKCCALLREVFGHDRIYRMGCNEFLAVCPDITQEQLEERRYRFDQQAKRAMLNVAVGTAWEEGDACDASILYAKAENGIHSQKRTYYFGSDAATGKPRNRRQFGLDMALPDAPADEWAEMPARTLSQFLLHHSAGMELLMEAVSTGESPIGLFEGDLSTNLFYISDSLRRMFGFEDLVVEGLLEKWEARICQEEDRKIFRQDLERIEDRAGADHDFKCRVYNADGEPVWVHSHAVVSYDETTGEPQYMAGFVSRQEFSIDPVTNLHKESAAAKKLEDLQRGEQCAYVLGIGLNHFAEINELLGRSTTDRLLRDIAHEWEQRLSEHIWFCRLDGVRFAAIVNPDSRAPLEDLVAELRGIVNKHCARYNAAVNYPCSVCAFQYPSAEFTVPEKLLDTMSMFIDAAKNSPAQEITFYSEKEKDALKSRAEYLLHLNEDVQNQFRDFRIVIQPIVSVKTRQITGGEVLLRWRYGGRDISPGVFIPLLEEGGLINQTGRWVFEEAVKQARKIQMDHPEFHLSFNVSYLQLSDRGFVPFMKRTIRKYGMEEAMKSGFHLTMELTENHFDENPEALMRFVESCRELGMLIALDDFGSGYSSLSLLMKYPADIVKLDRAIIMEVSNAAKKRNFMKTLVFACHEFGRKVCVEGVETAEDFKIVEETGGDMVQGYHFFRPMELEDFYRALFQDQPQSET